MKNTKLNYIFLNNSKNVYNRAKTILGIVLLSTFFLMSCKTDCENCDEDVMPDGIALNQRFLDNREDAKQTFTLDASVGGTIIGSQGTSVVIAPNSIGLSGVPVTGDIEIELIELYDKASMLLNNMPTSGVKSNGDEEALKSAGEFFINAKQNGNQLAVLTTVQIQSADVDFSNQDTMQSFKAGDNIEDTDIWEEEDGDNNGINDFAEVGERLNEDGEWVIYYILDISSFGWTNLDRWYNYTGQLTDIFIDVPSEFDGSNCEVFLTYDGEPTALARMDVYDTGLGMFTEHFGRIPVGQEIHIIMVAEIAGQLHYTIQGTTIIEDHIEVMTDPQPISQTDLTTLINGLP